MQSIAGSKPIVLGEVGWPSAGDQLGDAVPSVDNTFEFLKTWKCTADRDGIDYFWFEAFDEGWKPNHHNVEIHWGVWKQDRTPKFDLDLLRC